jgi:hypothetical protein
MKIRIKNSISKNQIFSIVYPHKLNIHFLPDESGFKMASS